MTIGNIYIEFHKVTTLGRPWGVIGGPLECREGSFDALGTSTGRIGAPRGLLGALQIQHQNLHKIKLLDDPIVIVKPTEYQHFHKIINVDQKSLFRKVMVKAMKY